tara:strand:+ start:382 stop:861 length:480 start_codon:yes stop_codon:yes gene_type:complete
MYYQHKNKRLIMVTFRNNNRRNNFRRNDRNFKTNGDRPKYGTNFSTNENFQRKIPGRNNHNAPKLIEKYNNLAREALSSGDKILSENYFQHADHFTRILKDQENYKKAKHSSIAEENKDSTDTNKINVEIKTNESENKTINKKEEIVAEEKEAEIVAAK